MPAPTAYTESDLIAFMQDTLKGVADLLEWSEDDQYQEAVNETLLSYGVDNISEITGRENVRRLRAIARFQVWKSVVNATAGYYNFSADNGRFDRSQIHEQARANMTAAETDLLTFDDQYRVGVDTLDYKHDPYQYRPEEDRTL